MIDINIKENKLNLIFGEVNSAKTTVIVNKVVELLKEGKEVLFFSPDTSSHHIEKKVYCLMEDIDTSSIKINNKTLKPDNIKVPKNLEVVDNCRNFEDDIYDKLLKDENKNKIIIIDNINQIDFDLNLEYEEKISKIFSNLNDTNRTIIGSFYLIQIADWTEEENFTDNDEKLGSISLVERKDDMVDIYKTDSEDSSSFKISHRNLFLESKVKWKVT